MVIDNAGVLCTPKGTCCICGGQGAILYADLHDHLFGSPGTWTLRQCNSQYCGMVWLDPQPLPNELGKLYRGYYTHAGAQATGSGGSSYESRGLKRLAKKALACVFFWKAKLYRSDFLHLEGMRPGRVLEVGCGDGAFLAAAARKGWESIGLDFDAAAVAQASRLPGVTADVGELNGKEYPGSSFDAIVMSNVIEHLANPGETLAECRRLLRPGGRLVIITPNFESLGRKLFKHNWRGLEPPRHLYLYAGNSLRSLCRQAGFLDMQIGSSPGGEAGREILLASIKIAHSSATGQSAPSRAVSKDAISLVIAKEYLLTLCGLSVGEWLVAILEK